MELPFPLTTFKNLSLPLPVSFIHFRLIICTASASLIPCFRAIMDSTDNPTVASSSLTKLYRSAICDPGTMTDIGTTGGDVHMFLASAPSPILPAQRRTPNEQKGDFVHFSNAGAPETSAAAADEGDDV